jgi:hypothetical protein
MSDRTIPLSVEQLQYDSLQAVIQTHDNSLRKSGLHSVWFILLIFGVDEELQGSVLLQHNRQRIPLACEGLQVHLSIAHALAAKYLFA